MGTESEPEDDERAYAGDSGVSSPDTTEPTARAEPPQAPPRAAAGPAGTGNRLAWLDVLRGLAALAVVFNHFGYFVPPGLKATVYQWVNPGDYGVFVFFLISGYIVPASLERKGSARTFWVSRRLDARFGPDRFPVPMRAPEPVLAHSSRATE